MRLEKTILPFESVCIAAQSSVYVVARPQMPVLPVRLWIPSSIGRFLRISDIKKGRNSQFMSVGEISAELFGQDEAAVLEKGQFPDPCVGVVKDEMWLYMGLRNAGPSSVDFTGHLECWTGMLEDLEDLEQRLFRKLAPPPRKETVG